MWFLLGNSEWTEILESDIYPETMSNGTRWTSRSPAYATKELLVEGQAIQPEPCKCCGQLIAAHYMEPIKSQMISEQLCFYCHFWNQRAKDVKEETMIVAGQWYTVAPEDANALFRGFGGRAFTFLKEGTVVTSTNVWYGGVIPQRFRALIPDNAILLPNS